MGKTKTLIFSLISLLGFLFIAQSEGRYFQHLRAYAVAKTHYGDPKDGCEKDEVAIKIQGVDGDMCAPQCVDYSCPTDMPSGVSARPMCALQDAKTSKKYCALICSKDAECGSSASKSTASCKLVGPVGLCTYSDELVEEMKIVFDERGMFDSEVAEPIDAFENAMPADMILA